MTIALTDSEHLETHLAPRERLDAASSMAAWAASGAMSVTGLRDGPPLPPPPGLVESVESLGRSIADMTHRASLATHWAQPVTIDAMALLGERAAIARLERHGRVSCGGATRLLECGDGRTIAVSLARPSDIEAIPAWLGVSPEALSQSDDSIWDQVSTEVGRRSVEDVVTQAVLLSMPIAVLGERTAIDRRAVAARRIGSRSRHRRARRPLVIDLSSLWAGPLCGHLLHLAGAEVIKVESVSRPDGARSGPPDFFSLLNAGKTMVSLDLSVPRDVDLLGRLLIEADVVIEASRPRALAQLRLTSSLLPAAHDRVWVTITGHGTVGVDEVTANRVGFGDDAAVAGGCVAHSAGGPVFCADAIADPLAGLAAAATTLAALAEGGSWSLDVALSSVAAWASGGQPDATSLGWPEAPLAAAPRARQVELTAGSLGADNRWLEQFERTQRGRR